MTKLKRSFIVVILFFLSVTICFAQTKPIKIIFWHSLVGPIGDTLKTITKQFNQSQSKYKVVMLYKGDYNTSLASLVAAYRAHKQPAIAQVLEVGTATMMSSEEVYWPVQHLMQQYGYKTTVKQFIPAIAYYYSDEHHQLQAFPFNVSSPILYYNKQAFKKAGLNVSRPPVTWPQLAKAGRALLKAGYHCGYTTAWPSWIQLEVFSAWQNVPFANKKNGLDGFATRILINNKAVKQQLTTLGRWEKTGVFKYGGRGDDAQSLFTSGECAMMTQSSGARTSLNALSNFPVGVAELPYWPSIKGSPQNTSIGGAALWVIRGLPQNVYRGVAQYLHYLLSNKIQLQWIKGTGYLPVTVDAYRYALQSGYYQQEPGAQVAVKELLNKPTTLNSRGIRLGNFIQIRDVLDSAMESIFSDTATVDDALKNATDEINAALVQFKENNV